MKLVLLSVVSAVVGCGGDDGGGGTELTIRAPNAPGAEIAYRDGAGEWMTAKGTDTPLTVPVTSGMYTVMFYCPTKESRNIVYQMTMDELSTLEHDLRCYGAAATSKVSGSLAGFNNAPVNIAFGTQETGATGWPGATFSIDVMPDTHDFVAARGSVVRDRLVIVRDLPVNGVSNQNVDFEGPNAIALEFPTTTGWPGMTYTYLFTEGGTAVELGLQDGHIPSVPASSMRPGDLLSVVIRNQPMGSPASLVTRTYITHSPPASYSLPSPSARAPSVTAFLTGSWTIVHAAWEPQAGASVYALGLDGLWTIWVSPGVFDETGTAAVPDLSQVPGWQIRGPAMLPMHNWSMVALSGATLEDQLRETPVREMQVDLAGWQGQVSATALD